MKVMLINATEQEECRVAVVDNGLLNELSIERNVEEKVLGNIYKGRVSNIEPSIQAAFIDFGRNRNGFLHTSDIMPAYARKSGKNADRRDISQILRKGQEVIVQITKGQIGTKVPTLTTYISIPGRYVVLMPSVNKCGVSKKIPDEQERRRIRRILREINPPGGMGYIARTAGVGRSKNEIARDIDYLLKLWKAILERVRVEESPATLYKESDLMIRSIRDVLNDSFDELIIDDYDVYQRACEFLKAIMPEFRTKVRYYPGPLPLFHKYELEGQIEQLQTKEVFLKSGGSIVIEQTEAMVSIDVNSGKYKEKTSLEETAYRTNLEATEEIVRQLKLRDLGGLVVCDFIDMMDQKHRNGLERSFREALRDDRARIRVGRMSRFSLIELTRQRQRESLKRSTYKKCPYCAGSGYVKMVESVVLELIRSIRNKLAAGKTHKLEIIAHPEVSNYFHHKKKKLVKDWEKRFKTNIHIRSARYYRVDEYRFV